MKVGLVPLLYYEYNYGGVLQFFALQQILRSNGIEVDIIFFENNEKICVNNNSFKTILKLKSKINGILKLHSNKQLEKLTEKRKEKINKFKEKYFSPIVDSRKIDFGEYAAVVCGSDQIWNPAWAKRRSFLEFVPDKTNKVIYGASLGCEELSEEEKRCFKPAIDRLQHVSVREYSAKRILDSFIDNHEIQVVLDPTLLLLPSEWEKIVNPCTEQGYIFTYFLGEYSDKIQYIKKFADQYDMKIINIPNASGERLDKNHFGDIEISDADPSEFLGLIRGSEYVFTDSFHACVFSILFQKQFFVFKRDNSSKMYGRIETLLKNFELPNRNIRIDMDTNQWTRLDYAKNESIQNDLRKESLEYLLGSIGKWQYIKKQIN